VRARNGAALRTACIDKFANSVLLFLVGGQFGYTKIFANSFAALQGRGTTEPADVVLEVIRKTKLSAERGSATPATDTRTTGNPDVQNMRRQPQGTKGAAA
jgi:hypothetical protein